MSHFYPDISEFWLKENLYALDVEAYEIKLQSTDEVVFKVLPRLISRSDKKKLKDKNGNTLFMMEEKIIPLRDRLFIEDAAGNIVYTVHKKSMVPLLDRHTINVWRGENDHNKPWLKIHGDLARKNLQITDLEVHREAAVISRQVLSDQSNFVDDGLYIVRVHEHYDSALMVFLAIALDEHYLV